MLMILKAITEMIANTGARVKITTKGSSLMSRTTPYLAVVLSLLHLRFDFVVALR
jgi:hypothetical protein